MSGAATPRWLTSSSAILSCSVLMVGFPSGSTGGQSFGGESWQRLHGKRGELQRCGPPGEPAAEPAEQDAMSRYQVSRGRRVDQRQRDRRGDRVSNPVEIDHDSLVGQTDLSSNGVEDADIRLV